MGFRSTFTTQDYFVKWPEWFRDKYSASIHFPAGTGPIAAKHEGKTYGAFANLHTDIQKAIKWNEAGGERFVLVYLHECGGITRCEIQPTSIRWNEPLSWEETDGVTHNYCYGCSDVKDKP